MSHPILPGMNPRHQIINARLAGRGPLCVVLADNLRRVAENVGHILKARPGMERRLRDMLLVLVEQTRLEPGCVKFILYKAMKSEGTFYLYEVYRSNADFFVHLKSEAVARFKRELATVSDSDQMNDLTQLVEVPLA